MRTARIAISATSRPATAAAAIAAEVVRFELHGLPHAHTVPVRRSGRACPDRPGRQVRGRLPTPVASPPRGHGGRVIADHAHRRRVLAGAGFPLPPSAIPYSGWERKTGNHRFSRSQVHQLARSCSCTTASTRSSSATRPRRANRYSPAATSERWRRRAGLSPQPDPDHI